MLALYSSCEPFCSLDRKYIDLADLDMNQKSKSLLVSLSKSVYQGNIMSSILVH